MNTANSAVNASMLTALTVNYFKQFPNLTLSNLGQFNLIVGANNVGKTSILEALFVTEDPQTCLVNLLYALYLREGLTNFAALYIDKLMTLYSSSLNQREFTLKLEKDSERHEIILKIVDGNLHFELNNNIIHTLKPDEFEVLKKDFILRFSNTVKEDIYSRNYQTEFFRKNALLNFVPFGRGFNKDFISFYAQHFTDRNKRKELVQQMKLFIPDIEEIDSATLNIYQTGSSAPTPLSQFGEGANKLFRVIMQLAAAQGSRLMIDEIDAGVHRYKFHSFWQTVIIVARHYDVQLFATTHNIECVEQFYLALQDPDMETYQNAARTLTLYKTTKNEVAVRTRNYKEFGEAITDERNIMGGD